jgi:hypothetical protein
MRYGLLVLAIVLCIGLGRGWLARTYEEMTTGALTEEARLAIDVRCPHEDSRAGRECRTMLKRLYLAGALEPDRTLRTWCDAVKTESWQASRVVPPEVCVERYGAW